MAKQVCVRTYPNAEHYRYTISELNKYLSYGYHVIMATKISQEKGGDIIEYILEKN